MGTCGIGALTTGMTATRGLRVMAAPGSSLLPGQGKAGCCAAAPGTTTPGAAARPTGTAAARASASASSVSASAVSPQDLLLDSLVPQALGPFRPRLFGCWLFGLAPQVPRTPAGVASPHGELGVLVSVLICWRSATGIAFLDASALIHVLEAGAPASAGSGGFGGVRRLRLTTRSRPTQHRQRQPRCSVTVR